MHNSNIWITNFKGHSFQGQCKRAQSFLCSLLNAWLKLKLGTFLHMPYILHGHKKNLLIVAMTQCQPDIHLNVSWTFIFQGYLPTWIPFKPNVSWITDSLLKLTLKTLPSAVFGTAAGESAGICEVNSSAKLLVSNSPLMCGRNGGFTFLAARSSQLMPWRKERERKKIFL